MNAADWGRTALVLFLALVAQVAVLDQLPVAGAHADLFSTIAVASGLLAGPQRGAMIGFLAGGVADLVVTTPYGLSALVLCVVAYATGLVRAIPQGRDARSAEVATVVLGTATATALYALVGALIGQPGMLGSTGALAVAVTGVGALVLALPVLAALRWSLGRSGPGYAIGAGGSATG